MFFLSGIESKFCFSFLKIYSLYLANGFRNEKSFKPIFIGRLKTNTFIYKITRNFFLDFIIGFSRTVKIAVLVLEANISIFER